MAIIRIDETMPAMPATFGVFSCAPGDSRIVGYHFEALFVRGCSRELSGPMLFRPEFSSSLSPCVSAEALGVGNASQRNVLGVTEPLLDFPLKQAKLLKQRGMPVFWQGLNQVLNHCPQAPDDLQVIGPAEPDFTEGKMYEILPVRRSNNHA